MIHSQLEEYFRKYYHVCSRVAYTMVKNRADAEDIAQETLLRLLLYCPKFKNAEHEKAWIIRTVINLCKDLLKSKWHTSTVGMESVPKEGKPYWYGTAADSDETLEDYSIREISGILQVPENTVKTHLKRGREALKQKLMERR